MRWGYSYDGKNVKRWVFILSLLLMMVPMPTLAQDGLNVDVHPEDEKLNFYGLAGQKESRCRWRGDSAHAREIHRRQDASGWHT